MVVGLTGRAGNIENKLIAALMLYKTTANELEKQVNANSVAYGKGQGEAENDFYQAQGTSDMMSGGMIIGQAGSELVCNGAGAYRGGSQTVEGGESGEPTVSLNEDTARQEKSIKDNNAEILKLKNSKPEVAISSEDPDGKPVGENDKSSKALAEKARTEQISKLEDENKDSRKQVKRNDERRSQKVQEWQRYGDTFGKTFQAADKFQSAVQSEAQGKHKQDEVTYQMANQINQNVQKGFETQKDTAASEITAAISAYGSQGLGQANLHRPV